MKGKKGVGNSEKAIDKEGNRQNKNETGRIKETCAVILSLSKYVEAVADASTSSA